MSKISIEEVENILAKHQLDASKIVAIVKDCAEVVEELKDDKDTTPKPKYEFVIVLHDKDKLLTGKEIAGWIVQQKDGADANQILSKLQEAAANQNAAAKRRKATLTSLTDIFERLKPKWLNKEIKIKTKNLTRVIIAQ